MKSTRFLNHPLRLAPTLMPRVWGGRRLEAFLETEPDSETPVGEAWLLHDRPEGSSRIAGGPWAGRSLGPLLADHRSELLGQGTAATPEGRFPLLIKLLDVRERLSVQVHPGEAQARDLGDQGKAEAWVALEVEPSAKVHRGLEGVRDREELAALARAGTLHANLRSFSLAVGDVVWIPPGTVHALEGGLLLYEIQQNSDLTFRLFDWGRPGLDGRPRELHLEQALRAATLEWDGESIRRVEALDRNRTLLIDCSHFRLERWRLLEPVRFSPEGRFGVLTVTTGTVLLEGDTLGRGATVLVPAGCPMLRLEPSRDVAELLVARPPVRS